MSTGEMNISLTGEETPSLDGSEVEDVSSAATGLSVPITSEEVAREISLTKQLEKLCDIMKELHLDTARLDEGTFAPPQGLSGPRGNRLRLGLWDV